jgi:hypothetical protein
VLQLGMQQRPVQQQQQQGGGERTLQSIQPVGQSLSSCLKKEAPTQPDHTAYLPSPAPMSTKVLLGPRPQLWCRQSRTRCMPCCVMDP